MSRKWAGRFPVLLCSAIAMLLCSAMIVQPKDEYARVSLELAYHNKTSGDERFILRRATNDAELTCDRTQGYSSPAAVAFNANCARLHEAVFRGGVLRPDEAYRVGAFVRYLDAFLALRQIDDVALPADLQQRRLLLDKDIEYRTYLLSIGDDFRGSTVAGKPSIPAIHLATMRDLLAQLEVLSGEIANFEARIDEKSLKNLELAADAAAAEGRLRATLPDADKVQLLKGEAERQVSTAEGQVELVQARQKEIEVRQGELSSQIDSITASMSKQITSAAASYFGVPEELNLITSQGSLEDRFKQYVGAKAQTILNDKEVLSTFGALGEGAAEYAREVQRIHDEVKDKIKTVQDAKTRFNEYRQRFEDIKRLVREPTSDNLILLGSQVLEHLDEDAAASLRADVCTFVQKNKPVRALVERARQPGAVSETVRSVVTDRIGRLPDFSGQAKEYARSILLEVSPARRTAWMIELLDRSYPVGIENSTANRAKRELAEAALRLWPRTVIEQIPQAQRERLLTELRRRVAIATEEELIDKIRMLAVPRLEVRLDQVILLVNEQVYVIGHWQQIKNAITRLRGFELEANRIQGELETTIERLSLNSLIKDKVLGELPFNVIEAKAEEFSKTIDGKVALWDGIIKKTEASAGCETGGAVAEMIDLQVGARMSRELSEAREAAVRHPESEHGGTPSRRQPTPTSSQPRSPEEQMMLQAAEMAFPGYGTAARLALSVWSGIQQTKDLARQIEDLTNESNRLLQQELQLLATIDAARIALERSKLEGEVSDAKRAAFLAQYDALSRATQTAGDQQLKGLQLIARRQPLVFYLAERLREEYDLLERSISLWGPYGGTIRDTIRTLVETDPQNLRLALDTDIHLYQWLDRDEERARTDIDRITTHWRQMLRLATDVCGRIGCLPGRSRLAQVQQTPLIDICDLMIEAECQRLRNWLRAGKNVADRGALPKFTTQLSFDVGGGIVPVDRLNVRIVDVRLGGYTEQDEPLLLDQAILRHPGIGFVRTPRAYARDALEPAETATFDWPNPWDLEALAVRWGATANPSRRNFEGYALFTTWTLSLSWSQPMRDLETASGRSEIAGNGRLQSGIVMRVAYSYHLPSTFAMEQAFVTQRGSAGVEDTGRRAVIPIKGLARSDLLDLPVPDALLRLIGTSDDYAAARAAWANQPESATNLSCDPSIDISDLSFAERLCVEKIPRAEAWRSVRTEARQLFRSCLPSHLLPGSSNDPQRAERELDQIIRTRFGKEYMTALAILNEQRSGQEPADPGALNTFSLCEAIKNRKG